jgi:hypothetical protein
MKAATTDDRRRIVMPPECPPNAAVTIQQLDENSWLVKRQVPDKAFKMVLIPVIDKLPDEPAWEEIETKLARHAVSTLEPEPE